MSESVTLSFEFAQSIENGGPDLQRPVCFSPTPYPQGLDDLFDWWLKYEEERDRIRHALTFDGFEYHCDFLHYRSEGPLTVVFYHGPVSAGRSQSIPRPPLLAIVDDWEEFLVSKEPFTKTYKWD